jgi:hypothetical protein
VRVVVWGEGDRGANIRSLGNADRALAAFMRPQNEEIFEN